MAGILYLVPTPIGNLNDISPRCARTLAEADFIAAEDTRVSLKLLNHLEIKKSLVSYHEHNKAESGGKILARLLAGETCALVTDAGSPAISDPGEDLVRLCAENGVTVCAIPGPCALVTALSISGLPTGRFTFEGFLSVNKKSRQEHLTGLKDETRTMIFYEAPHKLLTTLRDLADAFGEDRKISLCRELTKLRPIMKKPHRAASSCSLWLARRKKRTRAAHLKRRTIWSAHAWRRDFPRRTLSSRSRS